MNVDLYIVGTSHPLQCGSSECTSSHIQAFDAEIRRICATLKIKRIAEEMTKDGLSHYKAAETIGHHVAREINVVYQMVDLSVNERGGLSLDDSVVITTVQRWRICDGGPFREAFDDLVDGIRERVWIARLLSEKEWPTLFICGSDHTISVRRLCRGLGIGARVIHRDYEP